MMFRKNLTVVLISVALILVYLISCSPNIGGVVISSPDEHKHVYEAGEKIILKAAARVFKDKDMGSNVVIDQINNQVTTDYAVHGDWRTKSMLKVKKLNWKESEVVISVITEKKNKAGWEMRRLLEKEQYSNLFDEIDLAIYEEMAKVE